VFAVVADQAGLNAALKQRKHPCRVVRSEISMTITIGIIFAGRSRCKAERSRFELVLTRSFKTHASRERRPKLIVWCQVAQASFLIVAIPLFDRSARRLSFRHRECNLSLQTIAVLRAGDDSILE
jgi:hypothetical protein